MMFNLQIIRIIIVKTKALIIAICVFPLHSFADPFMGEGKKGYINRCIQTSSMPNASAAKKESFCVCLANRLEVIYPDVLKSIKQTDSVAVAQQKMVNAAQSAAKACM